MRTNLKEARVKPFNTTLLIEGINQSLRIYHTRSKNIIRNMPDIIEISSVLLQEGKGWKQIETSDQDIELLTNKIRRS